jgi:hypothetical protein
MGRRKLDRVPFPSYKVKPETLVSLKETAIAFGYTYGDGAAMGEFLDKIAALVHEVWALPNRDLLKLIFNKSSNN